MQRMRIAKISNYVSLIIIGVVSLFFFSNWNFFATPDPDIFQYFNEERQYMQLKLPDYVQLSPAYPILIGIVSKLFNNFPYPELLAAHGIIIISAILTLLLISQFLQPYGTGIAPAVTLLFATNPLYVYSSLNVNTESFFAASSLLVFILYQRNRRKLAYIATGLTFFIRYEGFILLLSLILTELVARQPLKKVASTSLLALIPIVIWMSVTQTHNSAGNFLGNGFIKEIIQHHDKIPQFMLYSRAPDFLINQQYFDMSQNRVVVSVFLFGALFITSIFLFKAKSAPLILMWVFAFLYLAFHTFFPYGPDRYFYPVTWIFYAVPLLGTFYYCKATRNSRLSTALFLALLCSVYILSRGNITQVYRDYSANESGGTYSRYGRHEVRDTADWLNRQPFTRSVIVFTYEPWIPQYFTLNPKVTFVSQPPEAHKRCDSIECLILSSDIDIKENIILYIQQSDSLHHDDSFPSAADFNVKIFNVPIDPIKNPSFVLLASLSTSDTWAKIYQYNPTQ